MALITSRLKIVLGDDGGDRRMRARLPVLEEHGFIHRVFVQVSDWARTSFPVEYESG